MLISVFNTPWFDTTGIYLSDWECRVEEAQFDDRSFFKFWESTRVCQAPEGYFIYHCSKFEKDPEQYHEMFHVYLEEGLKLKKCKEVEKYPLMFQMAAGTKIIIGQGVTSSSPHYAGEKESGKVYPYSVDIAYFIWFKTQEEVAKEINKKLTVTQLHNTNKHNNITYCFNGG